MFLILSDTKNVFHLSVCAIYANKLKNIPMAKYNIFTSDEKSLIEILGLELKSLNNKKIKILLIKNPIYFINIPEICKLLLLW
jgi:hypothetical protein